MVVKDSTLFKIENNFLKTEEIESICVIHSKITFLPKITIAIPTYKRPNLLKEAIDSALNQTNYVEYDVIVIDNNSERDCETEKLLHRYNNPILSYYKNSKNLQMAGNWNRAFVLAKGAYVLLLHDDDLLLSDFLSNCARILNGNKNIGILKPLAFKLTDDIIDLNKFSSSMLNGQDKIQRLYDFSNFCNFKLNAPTGIIFKKEDVIEMGGFNQDLYPAMDYCFIVVFSQKKEVYLYQKYLSIYRISVNVSLQLSTLIPSFEYSYYIPKNILLKYKIPLFIINWFLGCNLFLSIKGYKSYNSAFNYNISNMGLKEPNKIQIILFKATYKVLNYIIDFWTTKTV